VRELKRGQLSQIVGRQFERERADVLLEVRRGERSRNRNDAGRPRNQPRQRDLRRRGPVPCGDGLQRSTRADERAARKRLPWQKGEPLTPAVVDDMILIAARREVVPVLDRRDRHDPARRFDLIDRDVREPDLPDLSSSAQIGKRTDRLVQRDTPVEGVKLIEVNPLEPEPAEAPFTRRAELLGAASGPVLPRPLADRPALRRDCDTFRVRVQRLRDQLLAYIRPIRVCGIEQLDAKVNCSTQELARRSGIPRCPPTTRTGERHPSVAHAPHAEVGPDREGQRGQDTQPTRRPRNLQCG
jgi:hypothetical protein